MSFRPYELSGGVSLSFSQTSDGVSVFWCRHTEQNRKKYQRKKIGFPDGPRLLSQPSLGYSVGWAEPSLSPNQHPLQCEKASIAQPIMKINPTPFYDDGLGLVSPLTIRCMAWAQYHHRSLHFLGPWIGRVTHFGEFWRYWAVVDWLCWICRQSAILPCCLWKLRPCPGVGSQ